MKNLILLVGSILFALGGIALAIFQFQDTSLFVPPPEAVAEQFQKSLHTKRFSVAQKYLGSALKEKITKQTLEQLEQQLDKEFGSYEVFAGQSEFLNDSHALANVQIQSKNGKEVWPVYLLARESGVWKIRRIPFVSS